MRLKIEFEEKEKINKNETNFTLAEHKLDNALKNTNQFCLRKRTLCFVLIQLIHGIFSKNIKNFRCVKKN